LEVKVIEYLRVVYVTIVYLSDYPGLDRAVYFKLPRHGRISSSTGTVEVPRTFTIDYEHDQFLKDGEPFRYVAGSFHYFRAPRAYWRDRLRKMRAAGLNAVSTYVEWNQHEPTPGQFVFTGELDLVHFVQLAQEEDLLFGICRQIPHSSAYSVENEYGSYSACDTNHTAHLRDVIKNLVGDAAVLYTTDGAGTGYLRCGKVPNVYATVDFGPGGNVVSAFAAQRVYEPHGPLVNSEYYPGWLTHWGETLQTVGTNSVTTTLREMLQVNASVNFYMFFGGSNFGFMAGANYGDNYQPQITSYDYDAPLTEAGDPTSKYFAIREVIGEFLPLPNLTLPQVATKGAYGNVSLVPVSILSQTSPEIRSIRSLYSPTFEQLGQRFGFVLYETTILVSVPDPTLLSIPDISDRATVMVNGVTKGILSRGQKITSMPLSISVGEKLQILVENQGRINYGSKINDFKGLVSNVSLGSHILSDWIVTGFPLNSVSQFNNLTDIDDGFNFLSPTFFRGIFKLPSNTTTVLDTYLDTSGWGKNNVLILLELEHAVRPYKMSFTTEAILNKTPPTASNRRIVRVIHPSQLNEPEITFLMDGKPFRYISGSMHYFRVPRIYWKDRLYKLRAAGLNAVSTYVEWNHHEPLPGKFNFTDELDLQHFIKLAQEQDLLVLLRPGPYICAEREMGGLPSWLLTLKPDIKLRCNYMGYAEKYMKRVMSLIQPYLYGNGGPIILIQVENEYGSYDACDANYTTHVRDIVKTFIGDAALLYTTDGAELTSLQCGTIKDVYATVDFGVGADIQSLFGLQRSFAPHGPFINSEFYVGWLTHWSETFMKVPTDWIVRSLEEMLKYNASVNLYMFFGGTSFGFSAGANYGVNYEPQITSYDYDAPLTEAGDPTSKYFEIRKVIGKYLTLPNMTIPMPAPKGDYGTVKLRLIAPIIDEKVKQGLGTKPFNSTYPRTFEYFSQHYGFMLYETSINKSATNLTTLSIPKIGDRATVMVNGLHKGTLSRMKNIYVMNLTILEDSKLQILVENLGRVTYGNEIIDFKGILSNVTLDNKTLTNWTITGFPLDDISWLSNMTLNITNENITSEIYNFTAPAFFIGTFLLPKNNTNLTIQLDTFLDSSDWGKGVAFINGFNLGRYWPLEGPQQTLYVPGCYLKPYPTPNELILFELEQPNNVLEINFITKPVLDKIPDHLPKKHANVPHDLKHGHESIGNIYAFKLGLMPMKKENSSSKSVIIALHLPQATYAAIHGKHQT
ncbi:hypothetical protein C0J52_24075, partial [Blattella germanica]